MSQSVGKPYPTNIYGQTLSRLRTRMSTCVFCATTPAPSHAESLAHDLIGSARLRADKYDSGKVDYMRMKDS